MEIGTKSLLFGAHQFLIHPLFVALAWWKLYGFPFDPRLWVAFFVHDLGYWGKPNIDGKEGKRHPGVGAAIMEWLFGGNRLILKKHPYHVSWYYFCIYHSRFLADKDGISYSRLCFADKLSVTLEPWWLYLPCVILTGEIKEYMGFLPVSTFVYKRLWFSGLTRYLKEWVEAHA